MENKEKIEFRKMRRFKQQVSTDECVKILREEKRGVLAVNGEHGYPYAVPINFYYNEENGKIYFHGAKAGHKFDAMKNDAKVCFTVWNQGWRKDGEWSYHPTSVVCFATARIISGDDEKELAETMCRRLGQKYYPDAEGVEQEMEKYFANVQMFELTIEHMAGKLVSEK